MKKMLFCILVLGMSPVFGMESENSGGVKNENAQAVIEWGNGVLKDKSIRYYTEGPCGPVHLAVAQKHLAYLDEHVDKVKGDARTYLKLIQFALQTKAGQAWQEYEDKPGITPAQELMAFPAPESNPALVVAALDLKKEMLSRWTYCACCGPDERASLEARENALRHMLITGPAVFTDSVDSVGYPGRPGRNFLHYANNIVKRINADRFRCEGVTIYQKIKYLREQGKLNEDDCNYWRNQHCFHSKVGCHMKLEQEKEILRPILGQALLCFLPLTLHSIIVNYSAEKCDLLEDGGIGVKH